MHATTMRERQLNIRLTPEEDARFDRVAKHYGLTVPDVVRLLMKREEHDLTDGELERWARGGPRWERDKAFLEWLRPLTNLHLALSFDEETRTVSIESTKPILNIAPIKGLTRDEAVQALLSLPKTALVRVDPRTRVATVLRGLKVDEEQPPPGALEPSMLPVKPSRTTSKKGGR